MPPAAPGNTIRRRGSQSRTSRRTAPPTSARSGFAAFLPSRRSTSEVARAPDLLLQQQNAVEQRLRCRRAPWNINVHRHDPIAAAHYGIRVMIIAAAVGAGAHRNNPPRLRHLVVNLA